MDGPGASTSPKRTAAEELILNSSANGRVLFSDRGDAERYLKAVDDLRRSLTVPATSSPKRLSCSSSPSSTANALQIAMAKLEDEFRHILISKSNEVEIDSVDLSCFSMNSDRRDICDEETSIYRSSIREIDLLRPDAIADLKSIADRMIEAGYKRECAQVYGSVRKSAIDLNLRNLGVEKLSIGEIQKLEWEVLENKIRRWIKVAKTCVRVFFASESSLCDRIFESDESPFFEIVKGAAVQLFGFPDAISIGKRSPEKFFKVVDLHDAISELLPDIEVVFKSKSSESIYSHASDILSRLTEAVRGILSEFENAILKEPSKTAVPGGTIHPLTRYVMNYVGFMSEYKQSLVELIVSKPSTSGVMEIEYTESENRSPLASHLIWIIAILDYNLEEKANLYKDIALSHLFWMNNVHYIVHKVKESPELREVIGDDYLRTLTRKYKNSATSYRRATCVTILHFLREEGLHVSGSFSSGVSKSILRERFKSFNAAFDEVHRTQATWLVPDVQLRNELKLSMTELLVPAYRSFLGRFRHHIESGRHPEIFIKYSEEDIEAVMTDFFEGSQPNPLCRRKSH